MVAHSKTVSQTDISADHFLFRIFPKSMHPYLKLGRFDRPIGVWLLLFPALWAISFAKGSLFTFDFTTLKMMVLFFIGTFCIRAAGCTINDIWDRNIDAKVARTKTRPLPSGEMTVTQALCFLFFLLCLGFALLIQLNLTAITIGTLSLIPIAIYPLMKRVTFWPQLFLGITFNLSALIGWASITGSLSLGAYLLYISAIFWTLGYDTLYAHQDKRDDKKIGMKSTALALNTKTKLWVSIFYALSYLGVCFAYYLSMDNFSTLRTVICLIPALQLAWQIKSIDLDNPNDCLRIFKSNKYYGLLVLICFGL